MNGLRPRHADQGQVNILGKYFLSIIVIVKQIIEIIYYGVCAIAAGTDRSWQAINVDTIFLVAIRFKAKRILCPCKPYQNAQTHNEP